MKQLTFVVCIKQVPDPEGPGSAYEIDTAAKKVMPVGIPPVINPYDENALEVALRLKDLVGGKVIALSMSDKPATPVIKKALSVGADELIMLEDVHFTDLTSYSTAQVLTAGIKKIDNYDVIFSGRQAADWDSGQVGLLIAEILRIPGINLAQKVEIQDGKVTVEKLKRVGYEIVRAPMPALITVSSEAGDLRLPTLSAIRDARKKPVIVWRMADLGLAPNLLKKNRIRTLSPPPSRLRNCIKIEGGSSQEKAENLILRLRHDRVL